MSLLTAIASITQLTKQSDEQQSNELLMRIFRLSIPAMPRTASSFAIELTNKLKPMIQKPSGGFPIMKETIGCYCAVVNHLTKDYKGLMNILRACLRQFSFGNARDPESS